MATPLQMAEAAEIVDECLRLAAETGNACFEGELTELRQFAATVISRAAQSVASANLLAQAGLVGDAMSCGRTAVELMIDFAYVALDPERRIARFAAYAAVFHHKMATGVVAHGGLVPLDVLDELERRRDEFRDNNPGGIFNWAGCTIAERARVAGRDAFYRLAYADQCNASHSGPGTLEYALQQDDDGACVVHFGRQPPEAHPTTLAVGALLMLLGDVLQTFGLVERLGHRCLAISSRQHALVQSGVRMRVL